MSVDTEIWEGVEDIELIRTICLDKFGEEIDPDSSEYGLQLRSAESLSQETNSMTVAFLAVPDEFYDYFVAERSEYHVAEEVYQAIRSSIVKIGFDVCDRMMISAFVHGASPYYGGYGDMSMINRYGLFENHNDATRCALENNLSVPEHEPWSSVALYVTERTSKKLL